MGVMRAARPTFRNAHDKIAFAVHSSFLASAFILHATGPSAFTDDALYSSSTDEVGIEHWNELDDDYGFVYSNSEKGSKKILVKCVAMNDKLIVDALREVLRTMWQMKGEIIIHQCSRILRSWLQILIKKSYVNIMALEQLVHQLKRIEVNCEIIPTNVKVNLELLIQHFIPLHQGTISLFLLFLMLVAVTFFPGPGAGVYPTRGDFSGGGSMLVGVGVGREPRIPGVVPPGARFDPYGPPGIPGFEPNCFVRDPRRPGHGTHPDLEHFGNDSDYI